MVLLSVHNFSLPLSPSSHSIISHFLLFLSSIFLFFSISFYPPKYHRHTQIPKISPRYCNIVSTTPAIPNTSNCPQTIPLATNTPHDQPHLALNRPESVITPVKPPIVTTIITTTITILHPTLHCTIILPLSIITATRLSLSNNTHHHLTPVPL